MRLIWITMIVAAATATAAALGALGLVDPSPAPASPSIVGAAASAPSAAQWAWPTASNVVVRGWEAPAHDYGPGHRGIDVEAAVGDATRAPDDGTVAFAGAVGGRSVVTIDHGGGLVSTLDSVTPMVVAGDDVLRGTPVGTVAVGHCPATAPCLHLGARIDGRYVDPMQFLGRAAWPVLLPIG